MGGGDGDGGYEARQAEVEAKKADARRRLNVQFGEGTPNNVERSAFTTQKMTDPLEVTDWWSGGGDGASPTPEARTSTLVYSRPEDVFDQTGFDAAVAENAAIGTNRAARDKLYGTVRDNAYAAGKRGLDESRERESRDLRFELFAKGLNGGSEDVNQNAMLGRTYDRGILDLGAKADAASTNLRTSDEQTRLNLLQGIDSGMDQGSVLSSAANQLANNSATAAAEAQGTSLGDLFANAGLINQQSELRRGKVAGTDWWNTMAPGGTAYKSKSATGTITTS